MATQIQTRNLPQLIADLERKRKSHSDILKRLAGTADAEGRDLTQPETARANAARNELDGIDSQLTSLRQALTEDYQAMQAANGPSYRSRQETPFARLERGEMTQQEYDATYWPGQQRSSNPSGQEREFRVGGARVGFEHRTYNPDTDRDGSVFLRDLALEALGNRSASERLRQHTREEEVERGDMLTRSTTSTAPGAVVPQYLVDLYAPKARQGRHFADACSHHDLPEVGMTVYIPRVTTGTTTDLQTTENTAVSETDYADENVAVPVRTNAGSNSISRQNVERSLGTEEFVMLDLLKAYHSKLDDRLINAATWGLAAVSTTNTWTQASPTAALLYGKIQESGSAIESALLDLSNDDVQVVMHGRRWKWLQSQMTSTWPFINGAPGHQGNAAQGGGYAAGVRGYLPDGGPVVTSNNIVTNLGAGTNQDEVYVVAKQEAHLWEDPNAPLFIRAEQPGAKSLRIDLVIYGYFAAYFDRVTGVHRKITGTGLITPAF